MFWLASGLVIGVTVPFLRVDVAGLRALWTSENMRNFFAFLFLRRRNWDHFKDYVTSTLIFFVVMLFSSAAIGGLTMVGIMFSEYGSCTRF